MIVHREIFAVEMPKAVLSVDKECIYLDFCRDCMVSIFIIKCNLISIDTELFSYLFNLHLFHIQT